MGCPELIGRFEDKVDVFRQVRLPEAWYAALGEPKEVVLVPNAEGDAGLIPVETFAAECEVLHRKAVADPAVHRALEILERKAVRVEVDSQCYFRIGDRLREFAKIGDGVAFVGSGREVKSCSSAALERSGMESRG